MNKPLYGVMEPDTSNIQFFPTSISFTSNKETKVCLRKVVERKGFYKQAWQPFLNYSNTLYLSESRITVKHGSNFHNIGEGSSGYIS